MIDITCDVQQVDETGYIWAFLDEARDPAVIVPGEIVVAGDEAEPVFARVVDVIGDDPDRKVHLDILPGAPGRYLKAASRARLTGAGVPR